MMNTENNNEGRNKIKMSFITNIIYYSFKAFWQCYLKN